MINRIRLIVCCCLIGFTLGSTAYGAGSEFTFSGSDLVVDVNSKWIGGREGGYYPIRTRIRNIGPARTVTLQFGPTSGSQPMPTVSRSVSIEQNATVNVSLLIPLVDNGSYGRFRVTERGRVLKHMSQSISLPDVSGDTDKGPEMLIVSPRLEDGQFYNMAVEQKYNSAYYSYSSAVHAETVAPSSLPQTWLAYTSLDLLAIPYTQFADTLPQETRTAILKWVEAGGTLIVYDLAGATNQQSDTDPVPATVIANLDRLLGWSDRRFRAERWTPAVARNFERISVRDGNDNEAPEVIDQENRWRVDDTTFATRTLGLGQVVRFAENPFPGTASHWTWLLNQIDQGDLQWKHRHGVNSRRGNTTFMQFLIPGVGGVPVVAFLILITIFTLVIGPLNYGYYLRKKRLAMLLITVPVLAFGSSILLVGYSSVANGFSIKSRVRSVTIIDQKQNSSLSFARVAFYAGMAPSNGLAFEPTSAVFPIWPSQGAFESGQVNWSDTQRLQNGWLRSRTRTQFLVVSQREQRGRLDWQKNGSQAELSNGLEWPLEQLYVTDDQGQLWTANSVQPGAAVTMQPADAQSRQQLRTYLAQYELGLPEGLTSQQAVNFVQNSRSSGVYYMNDTQVDYQDRYRASEQERLVVQMSGLGQAADVPRNSYFAVVGKNPDLDLGVSAASERSSVHLLVGFFD